MLFINVLITFLRVELFVNIFITSLDRKDIKKKKNERFIKQATYILSFMFTFEYSKPPQFQINKSKNQISNINLYYFLISKGHSTNLFFNYLIIYHVISLT
jgi:hypothetical protein